MRGMKTADAFKFIQAENTVTINDEQLKQLQEVLTGILNDIVDLCEKHNICYTLSGGTALGAVRHGGFIPWDDDIDVNIVRRDYKRFIRLMREEYGEKYWVHSPDDTDGYALLLGRVRLKGTAVKTRDDFFNEECGAFVDLFIVENTFDNAFLRRIHGLGCMAMGLLLSCRKFYREREEYMKLVQGDPSLRRVFQTKIALGFLLSWGSLNFWRRLADRWNSICADNHSRLVTIPAGRNHFFGELYYRDGFCLTRKIQFGDRYLDCPRDVESYLTALYGDYMAIPPVETREKHVFFRFEL